MIRFRTTSPKETKKFAAELAKEISQEPSKRDAIILALFGNLGAGKTTFVQGFASAFGIHENIVSPTFVIAKIYEIGRGPRIKNKEARIKGSAFKYFIHIDCYRLKSAADFKHLGLNKFFQDRDAVVLIEWPERIRCILPKDAMRVYFSHVSLRERRIAIK